MTTELSEKITELRMQGCGYKAIASTLGIDRDKVRYHCKSIGLGGKAKDTLKDKGILCPQCGKPIEQPKGCGRKRRFCSDACRHRFWSAHPDELNHHDSTIRHTQCICCGRDFITYGNKHRKYCSRECYISARFWQK